MKSFMRTAREPSRVASAFASHLLFEDKAAQLHTCTSFFLL